MTLRIVVAVDSSPHARLALKVARTHYPDGHRQLVTVVDDRTLPFQGGVPVPVEAVVAEARRTLEDLAQAGEVCTVVVGEPAEALLRAAERFGADVLVMGTHGRYGLNRWFGGSVAETVVRRADLPVLVVREASVEEPEVPVDTGELNLRSDTDSD
ncbi:universal stress protein [Deinococcus sp.]|uniref:universal stress protein n=1 Tax=Deinococcus sp. TaxID=47478 RepID=UPI00286DEDE4|nr:universal stress protein [Deinococcus sp.]